MPVESSPGGVARCIAALAADRDEAVQHYRVPKREVLYAANHVEKTDGIAGRGARPCHAAHRSLARRDRAARCADVVFQDDRSDGGGGQPGGGVSQLDRVAAIRERAGAAAVDTAGILEGERRDWSSDWRHWSVDVDGQTLEVSVIQLATSPSGQFVAGQRQSVAAANAVASDHRRPTAHRNHDRQPCRVGQATLVNLLGNYPGGGMGSAALGRGTAAAHREPNPPGTSHEVVSKCRTCLMSVQLTASNGVGDGQRRSSPEPQVTRSLPDYESQPTVPADVPPRCGMRSSPS